MRERLVAWVGMTAAEAAAATYWIGEVHAADSIYTFPVVAAGAVLGLGLAIEGSVATILTSASAWNPLESLALATGETFVWTQWAIIVGAGMWSATGIGPATVVFAVLLTLFHAVETGAIYGESLQLRHGVTALVEALTVTSAWVVLISGRPLLVPVALATGFGIEHAYRLTDD